MKSRIQTSQLGVALVVALLFLLVVTVISITAMVNSNRGLQMVGNQQDSVASFQAAESGVYALLSLAGTASDPFSREDIVDRNPFEGVDEDERPLRQFSANGSDIDVNVEVISLARTCPRTFREAGGNSVGILNCDYYRVVSEHSEVGSARSQVELGVIVEVPGGQY